MLRGSPTIGHVGGKFKVQSTQKVSSPPPSYFVLHWRLYSYLYFINFIYLLINFI